MGLLNKFALKIINLISCPFKLIPLMVGSLNATSQDYYASILLKYFEDPLNIFVISSDFCHWGKRFNLII